MCMTVQQRILFQIMAKCRGALPPYVLNWGGKCPPIPPASYASVKYDNFVPQCSGVMDGVSYALLKDGEELQFNRLHARFLGVN